MAKKPAKGDPLTKFYRALDEAPDDKVTTQALADWYEEHGQADAADCLRWAAEKDRHPYRYRPNALAVSRQGWHKGWLWWAVEDPAAAGDWGHPATCRLPRGLWEKLEHTFDYKPRVFKEYADSRAAYEALLGAWPKYKRRRRATK